MLYDFTYYNPTKIHFGKDSLKNLKGELVNYGNTVLLAYGKNAIKKIGLYDELITILNESGKKKFLSDFEGKMNTTIKHRKLNRQVSYRYFIRLECYKLIKHFIGDEKYKVLKAWW